MDRGELERGIRRVIGSQPRTRHAARATVSATLEPTEQTPQAKMKARLERLGLPFKHIDVYGSQIVVTSHSRGVAERWARLLARFAQVLSVIEGQDYARQNRGTVLVPTTHRVFRTFARVPREE